MTNRILRSAALTAVLLGTGTLAVAQDAGKAPTTIRGAAASAVAAVANEKTQTTGPQRDSVWNGLVIGAAIGAAIGLVGADRCGNDFGCSGETWQFLALGAAAGAGVGLGVDALLARDGRARAGAPPGPRFRVGAQAWARVRALRASLVF
jgi:hypothetical protein